MAVEKIYKVEDCSKCQFCYVNDLDYHFCGLTDKLITGQIQKDCPLSLLICHRRELKEVNDSK